MMPDIQQLKIQLFADGADLEGIKEAAKNPLIKGFTTNPTLMRRANIKDYKAFALDMLNVVPDRSVSFEVFSDDFDEMEQQALEIASWGKNVHVKVPVTNTKGVFAGELIERLSVAGVQLNVTAIMTLDQVVQVRDCLTGNVASIISVFAGRIADTGQDPVPMMATAVDLLSAQVNAKLLWASPRELLNIFQADAVGCHIITATNDVLAKLAIVGKNLNEYSLDTVKMFYKDALEAGYAIDIPQGAFQER
jgi:transaldolase